MRAVERFTFHPLVLVLAGLAFAGAAAFASPIPVGPEIAVAPSGISHVPRVASDAVGNFMIVWEDDDMVHARRFYATGKDHLGAFAISDPEHEVKPSQGGTSTGNVGIAGDAAGNFVVAYNALTFDDYYDTISCYFMPCVFTRQNDANGKTSNGIFEIQNSQLTDAYPYRRGDVIHNTEIAAMGTGFFVVAWSGYDLYPLGGGAYGEDDTCGVFAARTTPKGQRIAGPFQVNEFARMEQGLGGDLSVAGAGDGSFVVAFRSEYDVYDGLPFPGGSVRAQLYDDKGNRLGGEFGVSASDATDGRYVDVARTPDGTFMVVWEDGGLRGRIFARDGTPITGDLAIGATSDLRGGTVAASESSFVVTWNDGEVVGKRFDLSGTPLTGEFQVNTTAGGSRPDVAAALNGDFVVTWKLGSAPMAQPFRIEPLTPVSVPLLGKALIVKNRLPDDPERNSAKWKAKGDDLAIPSRGTEGDPRCNGNPEGTVNATVRFWSDVSGHDTGFLPLPCENWTVTGSNKASHFEKRGFRYSDSKRLAGPCNSIKIQSGKSLSVSCKGKPGVQTFDFDLVAGTSEGTVHAMLELGMHRYCSSFPGIGFDGSDGLKFLGRNAAPPADPCPAGSLVP